MLESRIIIDSRHLGAFMGIKDLAVQAPAEDTDDATGGTTESGISGSKGLIFTGTPTKAGFDKLVSVTVDLSIAGPDQSTLVFTPTGVATGPNTADQAVPDDKRAAVLGAFAGHPARASDCRSGCARPPRAPAVRTSSSKASPRTSRCGSTGSDR